MVFKHILLLFILLIGRSVFPQTPMIRCFEKLPHGTVIVTIICKDGILIASDSRASYTDGEGKSRKAYAYFDNNQKIFTVGKFKMGISGIGILNMNQITEEYNKIHKSNCSLENTIKEFDKFLKTLKKDSDLNISKENQFFFAGFENSKPITMEISATDTIKVIRLGEIIHTDKEFTGYIRPSPDLDPTCSNIAPIIEAAIYRYAKDKNDNMIGGPVNIIQIKPDNTFFEIKSFKAVNFKTYEECAKAILNDKLKVEYLYSDSKEKLRKELTKEINLGNQ